jgi:hypothetical protein
MKKFYAILVVLALVVISSVAMAEVTVGGSVDIRNLAHNNTSDFTKTSGDSHRSTQERIRLNVDAKNDNVKGRVQIENDWDIWGRVESPQSNSNAISSTATPPAASDAGRLKIREGWIDFTIPGAGPAHVKVGHQFLALGNGWFFRSGKYGSDAWLVGLPGKNTVAFVNVKAAEFATASEDDTDAFVLLDNFKIDDTKTVGAYFARVRDPQGKFVNSVFNTGGTANPGAEANLDTIGLWFNGKLGPINFQAEIDVQSGKAKDGSGGADTKFKGNQIVLQANMPIDPLSVNVTLAQGSGQDLQSNSNDLKQMMTLLDADPHYTFIYEYLVNTACIKSVSSAGALSHGKNTGFCNTTAAGIGAGYAISKNLSVNVDLWMLQAVEKVNIGDPTGAGGVTPSDDLGTEVDVVIKWKLYDQLTWNWQLGQMMPGKAYDKSTTVSADNITAVQGILSYKF